MLAPVRPRRALGVQEVERQTDPAAIARTRLGKDGEPELLLFDDIGGYGWNVPKSDWLNVGCGTLDASAVHDGWRGTRGHLNGVGHPPRACSSIGARRRRRGCSRTSVATPSRAASAGCSRAPSCQRRGSSTACSTSYRRAMTMLAEPTQKLLSSLDPKRAKDVCVALLADAGVTVGGTDPWDISI